MNSALERMAGMPQQSSVPEVRFTMQFFEYSHLPEHLQQVSAPFGDLAQALHESLPNNAEKQKALNKLLEAKDAAVRALVAK